METTPSNEVFSKQLKIIVLNKNGQKIDEYCVRGGTNLWVFLRKRGLAIGAACSGVGVCGACNVQITESSESSLSQQNNFEKHTLERNSKPLNNRLACLCRVYADITVQADYW